MFLRQEKSIDSSGSIDTAALLIKSRRVDPLDPKVIAALCTHINRCNPDGNSSHVASVDENQTKLPLVDTIPDIEFIKQALLGSSNPHDFDDTELKNNIENVLGCYKHEYDFDITVAPKNKTTRIHKGALPQYTHKIYLSPAISSCPKILKQIIDSLKSSDIDNWDVKLNCTTDHLSNLAQSSRIEISFFQKDFDRLRNILYKIHETNSDDFKKEMTSPLSAIELARGIGMTEISYIHKFDNEMALRDQVNLALVDERHRISQEEIVAQEVYAKLLEMIPGANNYRYNGGDEKNDFLQYVGGLLKNEILAGQQKGETPGTVFRNILTPQEK